MEKDTLEEIKALELKARKLLASVRKARRQSRSRAVHSYLVDQHVTARKSGMFSDHNHELFVLNKMLESDELSSADRKTFARRVRILQEKLRKTQAST